MGKHSAPEQVTELRPRPLRETAEAKAKLAARMEALPPAGAETTAPGTIRAAAAEERMSPGIDLSPRGRHHADPGRVLKDAVKEAYRSGMFVPDDILKLAVLALAEEMNGS